MKCCSALFYYSCFGLCSFLLTLLRLAYNNGILYIRHPNMIYKIVHRAYVPGLGLWWFSSLVATKVAVSLRLYGALVCPDNVIEVVAKTLLCPLKTLRFIALANQLAVGTASEHPPQSCATSEDRLQSHGVAVALKESMQLDGSRLIIVAHLLLHERPHCRRHLSRSARTWSSLYAPCFVVLLQNFMYPNAASSQALLQ